MAQAGTYPLARAALAANHYATSDSGVGGSYLRMIVGEVLEPTPGLSDAYPTRWTLTVKYLRFRLQDQPGAGVKLDPNEALTVVLDLDLGPYLTLDGADPQGDAARDPWSFQWAAERGVLALLTQPLPTLPQTGRFDRDVKVP